MNEKRDKKRFEEFGKYLKETRDKLGLSQDEVAARCDVTKGNLSMIENGKKDFAFSTFLEIALGMDIHPKQLLDHPFDFMKEK
jgi:transcriptional regulator with XRE-family HTH domain